MGEELKLLHSVIEDKSKEAIEAAEMCQKILRQLGIHDMREARVLCKHENSL